MSPLLSRLFQLSDGVIKHLALGFISGLGFTAGIVFYLNVILTVTP